MAWTSPRTWTAGETVTAALLNVHLRDNLKAIGDAWTAFTPTLTGWTLGNGSFSGSAYRQVGKGVDFRIKLLLGSTTVVSAGPVFTLPATAISIRSVVATVLFFDTSAGAAGWLGGWAFAESTTLIRVRTDASATPSTTVPFTWAAGDEIVITGTYEAA